MFSLNPPFKDDLKTRIYNSPITIWDIPLAYRLIILLSISDISLLYFSIITGSKDAFLSRGISI